MARIRQIAPLLLAAAFALSATVHLVRPQVFEPIMPRALPEPTRRPLIYASGVAELACAIGLVRRATWAAAASTSLLVAVLPANVQMALDAGTGRHPGIADNPLLAWGRLPLQIPMVWAARQARVNGNRAAAGRGGAVAAP